MANLTIIRNNSGAAGVEMALMLPLLLVLMFGPFEMANYFWTEHKAIKGVRDGARYAARLNFSNFECGATMCETDTDFEGQVKNLTRTGLVTGGQPSIANWVNDDVFVEVMPATSAVDGSVDGSVTTGIYRGLPTAPRVLVSTTVSYTPLFGLLGFDTSEITVSVSSQAAVMGI